MIKYVLLAVAAVLAVLIAVLLVRALRLKPEKSSGENHVREFTDEQALERFCEVLRQETVWPRYGEIDYEKFEKFLPLLKSLYPEFTAETDIETVNKYGILIRWRGSDSSLKPIVLMSHYDVVSADESKWDHPPFGAEVIDGEIWARGTVDTKCILSALMEAGTYLLKGGFRPKRDIWFSFTNNEETGGDTTPAMVDYFQEKGIEPWMVLDEGGAIVNSPALGVKAEFAMVGVSEKGVADTFVTVSGIPGHSSTPRATDSTKRAIDIAKAIEKNPFKSQIAPVVAEMLSRIAACSSFGYRLIFANLWFFSPLVKKIMSLTGETSAMLRTTTALTKLEGAKEINIIPNETVLGYSVRIAPWDSVQSAIDHIQKIAGENASVKSEYSVEPSPVSDYSNEQFALIEKTVKAVYPDVKISPYIMTGGTDSKHFTRICPDVYRFAGFRFTDEDREGMHGNNEKLSVDSYYDGIDFYIELIRNFNNI